MIGDDDDFGDDPENDLPSAQPTVDAARPVSVRRQREKANLAEENAQKFWQRVFADPVGRREMWNILQEAHTFNERFACGPNGFPQVEATFFHAGEQAFGLRLYQSWMLMDRAGVMLMHDEHDVRFIKPKPKRGKR